jgi:hypothetical protein
MNIRTHAPVGAQRRDAEWEEAEEQAAKWVCIAIFALALAFFAGVAL